MSILKVVSEIGVSVILIFLMLLVVAEHREDHRVNEMTLAWGPLASRVDSLELRTVRLEGAVDAWIERQ